MRVIENCVIRNLIIDGHNPFVEWKNLVKNITLGEN